MSKRITSEHIGYCKLCRAGYEVITCEHAKKHGFKTPEEMAQSDIVKPLGGRK